jgi:phosphatidylglycerol:prolipoprotein diacylglycerol transferase
VLRAPAAPAPRRHQDRLAAALRYLSARPILWRRGEIAVFSYGSFVALGFGLATVLCGSLLELRFGAAAPSVAFLVGIVACSYAGSRVVFAGELAWARRLGQRSIAVRGHALYGGLLGALAFAVAAYRDDLRSLVLVADCAAPGIALGYASGKLGCLAYGCCIGRPTRSRLSVRYSSPVSRACGQHGLGGIPLMPVQLFEGAVGLTLAPLLAALPADMFGTGRVLGLLLLALAVTRLPLMGLRYRLPDERAGRFVASGLSLVLATLGVVLLAGVAAAGGRGVGGGAGWTPGVIADGLLVAGVALAAFAIRRLPPQTHEENRC